MIPIGTRMVFKNIAEMHDILVPTYKSRRYSPLLCTIQNFELDTGARIGAINPDRAEKRIRSYTSMDELLRAKEKMKTKDGASIRFGVSKEGTGTHGERGDFCLVGGYAEPKELHMFWRSLELQGGFGYDLAMITHICTVLGIAPKALHMYCVSAHCFSLRGNSNEKLFPKLKDAIHGR